MSPVADLLAKINAENNLDNSPKYMDELQSYK